MQFRTKARAVDLLGKGQIADLPTAITELWKNGYDAYADRLTAELFLPSYKDSKEYIFAITDDGKGMSSKDIADKWLVLGTDSKSRGNTEDLENEETLWKSPRVKAGEKGIGRLSVAFLGSPILMLTKKRGFKLQLLYFDWRLLENFNLFLEDIIIPIKEIESVNQFRPVIDNLRHDFLLNMANEFDIEGKSIWEENQSDLKRTIINQTENLHVPKFFEEEVVSKYIDLKAANGTCFYIFNPEQQIIDLISNSEESDKEFIRSSLVGFTNQFKKSRLPIQTAFPIHKSVGNDYDFLTSKGNFFSEDDFKYGDILIDGEFDGKGNFSGELTIYGEKVPYVFTSSRKKEARSNYGAFNLKLGYLMGRESESQLSGDVYRKLQDKIDDFGGIYIYRDGFRVLPYGRTESDFLEFERRRALKAGEYFFSHRRMYGFIEISRSKNPKLIDKAGREGLINNAAYRAFKFDLQSFFIDLSKEYFSDKAKKQIFRNTKDELKSQSKALEEDKKREKAEKSQFTRSLKEYPKRFEGYKKKYINLSEKLSEKIKSSSIIYSELEDLLLEINRMEIEFQELLPHIPKRYKPTDTQLDRLSSYENQLSDFTQTYQKQTQDLIQIARDKLAVQELKKEFINNFSVFKGELQSSLVDLSNQLKSKIGRLNYDLEQRSSEILKDFDREKDKLVASINNKKDVLESLNTIRKKFDFLRQQINAEITPLVQHVQRIDFSIDEELLQGFYKSEYDNIKYQWNQTKETAQLGIAVEIIDHEFNVLYSQINASLKKLDRKLNGNFPEYDSLKNAFIQLEDKYALLSPLYRSSGVTVKNIKGSKLIDYLVRFFSSKIDEESVLLESSNSFLNHFIEIKEPVIHTVLINIINNALYWIRSVDRERKIYFDYNPQSEERIIANSGSRIPDHRLEKIFDLFYSNRPNGRGIGLYLARQSLQENGYEIFATNNPEYNTLDGACFVIKPMK